MSRYEYTVVPAPTRGEKAAGAKTPGDRFALTLAKALNDMAADGWEYLRAEVLPSEERSGLTSRTTVWNNVLVFRRTVAEAPDAASDTPTAKGVFSQPMRAVAQPEAAPAGTPDPQ